MAQGKNERLNGSRELPYISQKDSYAGSLFQRIIRAVNALADNANVSSVGKLTPPPPIDSINVQGTYDAISNTLSVPGEVLHHTLVHNQSIKKGIKYFSEIDTDPNFPNPHPIEHGSSRSSFLSLPTLDNGGNVQPYYLRSFPQYKGSDPQKPTVFGGLNGATKIVLGGTSRATLLTSHGSGTATNGQQGAKGLGVVLTRPAPGPKRNTAPTHN